MRALIFDIDGTLWDTRAISARGYNAALQEMGRRDMVVTPEYLASYYAESMNFVVMRWIETGMKASPDEMVAVYEYIGTRSLGDLLPELK